MLKGMLKGIMNGILERPRINQTKLDNIGNHLVGVGRVSAYATDRESQSLPQVLVLHFSHGDVERVSDTGRQRTGYLTFVL